VQAFSEPYEYRNIFVHEGKLVAKTGPLTFDRLLQLLVNVSAILVWLESIVPKLGPPKSPGVGEIESVIPIARASPETS